MASKYPPVAIVGVSALFPGSVTAGSFWKNIMEGTDLLSDIPDSHFLLEDYYDADPTTPDKTYAKRGGFLPDVPFAPMDFGVPPNIIPATDTAQLLALNVAKRVLEDAVGTDFQNVDRDKVSCVLGVASATELVGHMSGRLQQPVWERALRNIGLTDDQVDAFSEEIRASYTPWQESTFPGLLGNVVAGRIANRLDLGGTNVVVDAACASSLAAVEIGLNELYLGQSDLVITGGVDTLNDILMFMCFSKTPALSPSGDCRPFSDAADGTMLGEGIGMVALKRLADAERDGDAIYGVIKGMGTSSDGRSKSIYAPVSTGQAKALRRAYDLAGYGPDTVELVEAHGTGTKAGDKAEFGGLEIVFQNETETDRKQWCALGTVKSQIGHTKAAAGSAGLVKIAMALHHKVLPPTIKVDKPHTQIDFEQSPFYLNTEARPWIRSSDHPRRASVSAFGFGGTNFHCTVEEYRGPKQKARHRTLPSELFVWSAADIASLKAAVSSADVAGRFQFASFQSQQDFDATQTAKAAIVAHDEADFQKKQAQLLSHLSSSNPDTLSMPNGIQFSQTTNDGDVAFIFPGQGSQYVNMGADLSMFFDAAREAWDAAADHKMDGTAIHEVVFPQPVFDDAARDEQQRFLTQTEWAQPAIGTASTATLKLMTALGVKPSCVGGHSYGEITALHSAGVFDTSEMLAVSRKRGVLMAQAAEKDGTMTAVVSTAEELKAKLDSWGIDVVIANHNAPTQVVLSGATAQIEAVEQKLQADGMKFKRLSVSTAFHSSVVSDSVQPFAEFLGDVSFSAPSIPVYANSTASTYSDQAPPNRELLANQIGLPVRFVEQIEAMYAAGVRTFIEVGPDAVLTNLVSKILADEPHVAIATDRRGKNGIHSFFNAVAQMCVAGVEVDFTALWTGYDAPIDQTAVAKPAMTVPLRGSNYDKPSPYREPTARAKAVAEELKRQPEPVVIREEVIVEKPVAVASRTNAPNAAVDVSALERLQRETARVQSEYQRMMADSHATFLQMAETSLQGLIGQEVPTKTKANGATNGHYVTDKPLFSIPETPVVATMPTPQPVAPRAEQYAAPVPTPTVSTPSQAPVAPTSQPVAAPTLDLTTLMLDVVADKTGYPAEMLDLSMELEADLGIDSIKRVEILSAMQEEVPSLPEVDTGVMASLVTLQEIVDYMSSLIGDAPVAVSSAPQTTAQPNVDLTALMLNVVADKTGYPAEMLDLSMELEADLGIDSIKRVEILSAMQEEVPSLPEVDTGVMASLVTLQEIVDYMSSLIGSTPNTQTSQAAPAQSNVDLTQLMLKVVADKTGYPAEMLELSMELEADLGIDSIKRVEILSAMQEEVPSLPEVDTGVMASLVTLQEIVDYMGSLIGQPASPAATTSATSTAQNDVDLTQLMLQIVADKTGYPAEMLELSMELEADLGIDSIKRVEILSAMQEEVPSLPEVDTQTMAALVTLQEIVDYMASLLGQGGAPQTAPTPEAKSTPAGPVTRYVVKAVPAPPRGLTMHGLAGLKTATVVTPDVELGAVFQTALSERGIETKHAASAHDVASDAKCVIYLSSLRPQETLNAATAIQRDVFETATKVASNFESNGGVFVTVQNLGGDFGRTNDLGENAFTAGVTGLVKSMHKEWSSASVRAIDLNTSDAATVASTVLHEMWSGGPEIEVGFDANGNRQTFVAVEEDATGTKVDYTSDDVIVVSGGARGVTAACVVELAKTSGAKFVLLGRTELQDEPSAFTGKTTDAELKRAALEFSKKTGADSTPKAINKRVSRIQAIREIRKTIADIEATGTQAIYVSCDVRDRVAISAALDTVRNTWGPITGVVHGAGVIADQLLSKKTTDQFDFVFLTKVDGLQSLLEVTANDPLSLICLFSSVAGRTGNPGQSDYAMANEVLNRIAAREQIRRPNCVVKSLGWGPWESGMVTPALAKIFEARGIPLIGLQSGAEQFVDDVTHRSTDVEVVIGGGVTASGINAIVSDGKATAEIEVSQKNQPFLTDHTIQGRVVVPVVMAMEWMARGAAATHPGSVVSSLRDVRVLRGVTIDDFENANVLTTTGTATNDGFEISVQDTEGKPRYSASVDVAAERPETKSFAGLNGDVSKFEISTHEFYTDDTLFHGPSFQCLKSVDHMSENGARATLHGVANAEWNDDDWVTDPLMIDGCLQLALLWGLKVVGQQTLPMRIDSVTTYSAPKPGALSCELVLTGEQNNKRTLSDIRVTDVEGNVVCDLRGVEMFVVPGGASASAN